MGTVFIDADLVDYIKVNLKKDKKVVKVFINIQIELSMMDRGEMI